MGEAALHFAARNFEESQFQINVLQLFLTPGPDVNARDNRGSTPLHHSSSGLLSAKGSVENARLLLERGASIDSENNESETPLQVASKAKHHEMVKFLSGLGAE